jgi:hypothetical protein
VSLVGRGPSPDSPSVYPFPILNYSQPASCGAPAAPLRRRSG